MLGVRRSVVSLLLFYRCPSVFASQLDLPTVKLDGGIFTGVTSGNLSSFLGIPYAEPPIGDLRFRLPKPITPYKGSYNVTDYGPMCYQQPISANVTEELPDIVRQILDQVSIPAPYPQSEDCLTLNVIRPANINKGAKLPVAVWIYGGAFDVGATQLYNGSSMVAKSIELGEPIIFVAMNYRLSGLGFLASKEVKAAGVSNLGLRDQREALRWVQKRISAFGGDPKKVTIWGESAGAMSVALHMVMNDGNQQGLFRGAFMQSGSVIPVGDIEEGQVFQDELALKTNCSNVEDVLGCLRKVDFATLRAAMDVSTSPFDYTAFRPAWLPHFDGDLFKSPPQTLVTEGKVAKVPFVNGDTVDEGTFFSFSSLNVTTDDEFKQYVTNIYLPTASTREVEKLAQLYPADPTKGSPFGTGVANQITPQFKRISAFHGDFVFQAPRRLLIEAQSSKQNVWSYSWERYSDIPLLGSYHGSDLGNTFSGGDMAEFVVNFVNHLDPNGKSGSEIIWPRYRVQDPLLLTFTDNATQPLSTMKDDHRKDAIQYVEELFLKYPL